VSRFGGCQAGGPNLGTELVARTSSLSSESHVCHSWCQAATPLASWTFTDPIVVHNTETMAATALRGENAFIGLSCGIAPSKYIYMCPRLVTNYSFSPDCIPMFIQDNTPDCSCDPESRVYRLGIVSGSISSPSKSVPL